MKHTLIFSICLVLAACSTQPTERADIVIANATVIDVKTGQLSADQSLAIRDGVIIKRSNQSLKNNFITDNYIDANDQFLMPGLWDMHVHFGGGELIEENKQLLPLYLAYGITTVRDAAADLSESVLNWRSASK